MELLKGNKKVKELQEKINELEKKLNNNSLSPPPKASMIRRVSDIYIPIGFIATILTIVNLITTNVSNIVRSTTNLEKRLTLIELKLEELQKIRKEK
jgi:hypothetical protein